MADQSSMHGNFYWNGLLTHDVAKAKKFYGDVIGWSFESMQTPMDAYWIAKVGENSVGELFPLISPQFDGVPEARMSYLAVDDVDARVKKAAAAGAKLMKPVFDIPGVGRIAILTEPDVGRITTTT